jgi:diaminopropionate ammonia-lyase
VKDESNRFGLPAFKILGPSWAIPKILSQRFGLPLREFARFDTIRRRLAEVGKITLACATDGNHGRAVAFMGRMLGLPTRVYVPDGTSTARIQAVESEGATVVVGGTYEEAIERAAAELEDNGLLIQDNAWEGYEEIPRLIVEGYSTMLWEIEDHFRSLRAPDPTHVVVQVGVGSLADAVVRHYRRRGLGQPPVIICVEPVKAACLLTSVRAGEVVKIGGWQNSIMAGLNCAIPSAISFPLLRRYVDCFMSVEDDRAREAMCELAAEGIVAGETGAAGLAGLLELVRGRHNLASAGWLGLDHTSRVLLFNTEGATDPASFTHIVGRSPDTIR